jgi:alpha-L-fucosidase
MKTPLSRRNFIKSSALAAGAGLTGSRLPGSAQSAAQAVPTPGGERKISKGPFQPTWDSLTKNYHCPEWFRDAKFGIWAHWSAQCVPEQGDWYARRMYLQGDPVYDYHVKVYGHPSKFGFMEIDNLWKAERWEPEKLMALYKRAQESGNGLSADERPKSYASFAAWLSRQD